MGKRIEMKRRGYRAIALLAIMTIIVAASTRLQADQTAPCGGQMTTIPFDDVLPGNIFFCSIAEAYFSALTNGTSATTYSPSANVPREQMAAFITRTMDQSVKRSSRRAALNQYWTTQGANNLALTTVSEDLDLKLFSLFSGFGLDHHAKPDHSHHCHNRIHRPARHHL
jgi:hypothetical protein